MGFEKEKERGTDKSVFSYLNVGKNQKNPYKNVNNIAQMLAEPIDKMADIKNPMTTDEKTTIDITDENDDEDLEEGELTESEKENDDRKRSRRDSSSKSKKLKQE